MPEVGERQAARGAQQQPLSQRRFEIGQAPRDRGLGHAEMLGSPHQAFLFDDGDEQDVIIGRDIYLFHLWNSLSQFNGFIYFFEPPMMHSLSNPATYQPEESIMKLLAFAASSSRKSINKQLVTYAASLVEGAEVEVLDLNDYELPLFSEDREAELGHPELAKAFLAKIAASDALMISFAEHNGSYSAAWKNLFDWSFAYRQKVFQDKPMVLLSTSPGPRGGASVLAAATGSVPFFGGRCESQSCDTEFLREF